MVSFEIFPNVSIGILVGQTDTNRRPLKTVTAPRFSEQLSLYGSSPKSSSHLFI